MEKIVFDFNNTMAEIIGKRGFTKTELSEAEGMLKEAHRSLNEKELGFSGFQKGRQKY